MSSYEKGDTIEIPVTFTDPVTEVEASSVPDAKIQIFKGNTQILALTPLVQISGGKYFYLYTIPVLAASGVYTVYVTGTVGGNLQTATMSFSVTDRLTNIQSTADGIKLDIQAAKLDLDSQLASVSGDIGGPSADGTTLHDELKNIISDLGNPLLTGQDITQKLDDIRTTLGLGTPIGSVSVTGNVIDENGSPITGVRVIAINRANGNATDTNITAIDGSYILHLNPGSYVLQFVQTITVLKQTYEISIPTLVTSFTVPNIKLATKRSVSDVVNDPNGIPLPGVLVKAILQANFNPNAIDNKVEGAAFTDENGKFTLDLFPGVYVFQFVKSGFDALPETFTVV